MKQQNKNINHIVIIAGEASSDEHAAALITKIKHKYPNCKISGLGGIHMESAGVNLISNLAQFGLTGIIEVVRHLKIIKKAYTAIKKHLAEIKPDLLILVDYPGFNLRLAKFAKQILKIKILYYISPQIWAWKPKRIDIIRKYIDHMAVIFPFEKAIYQKANIPVSFVGHPIIKKIPNIDITQKAPLRHNYLIAMLPGSRMHEIKKHMPILLETAKNLINYFKNINFIIPIASTIKPEIIKNYLGEYHNFFDLIPAQSFMALQNADLAIVASGTASLECALLKIPMCIIYKASIFNYCIATQFIRIKYLGLCNILANQMISPELLQYDCNPQELTKISILLLQNKNMTNQMRARFNTLYDDLSTNKIDCELIDLI